MLAMRAALIRPRVWLVSGVVMITISARGSNSSSARDRRDTVARRPRHPQEFAAEGRQPRFDRRADGAIADNQHRLVARLPPPAPDNPDRAARLRTADRYPPPCPCRPNRRAAEGRNRMAGISASPAWRSPPIPPWAPSCTPRALHSVTSIGISGRSESTPAHRPWTAFTPFRCGHCRRWDAGACAAIQKSTAMSASGSAGMRTSSSPLKPASRAESTDASMPMRIRTPWARWRGRRNRPARRSAQSPRPEWWWRAGRGTGWPE